MGKYADSAEWGDIEPLYQNDGPGQPLAAIMYPEAYSEAMSYLRAIIAKQETSQRVLDLTEDIIKINPAHYTVWYITYRKDNI
jgi:protein farnesyltransferase/geranylgeranyltransferase type-1 subunit alpha